MNPPGANPGAGDETNDPLPVVLSCARPVPLPDDRDDASCGATAQVEPVQVGPIQIPRSGLSLAPAKARQSYLGYGT